tara:strand:+ start:3127 stop:3393 length:267 start_codon:yes stop_codon:yes gene_type:complete
MSEEIKCPENYICLTENEWWGLVDDYEVDSSLYNTQPTGDAQAAIDFTWQILFLSPWELAYIALPMTVLAFYGLTIYSIYKYIQTRFR